MEEDFAVDFLAPEVVRSAVNATDNTDDAATIKGIPNFWLETLNNSSMTGTFECDRTALKYLHDIQLDLNTDKNLTFSITFKFDPNPYFENESLTKVYLVECSVDPSEPFAYDGAQIYRSIGCEIKWKDGMDYTKNQNSFFNFFSPPCTDTEADIDPDTFEDITADFEMGLFLKERMIPKAVLYFLSNEFESDDSEANSSSASDEITDERILEDDGLAWKTISEKSGCEKNKSIRHLNHEFTWIRPRLNEIETHMKLQLFSFTFVFAARRCQQWNSPRSWWHTVNLYTTRIEHLNAHSRYNARMLANTVPSPDKL